MATQRASSIYAIRCKTTGKVYIGRSQDPRGRARQHLQKLKSGTSSCGTPSLQADFDLYGASDFELYILENGVAPANFRERESYWINHYRSTDPMYGYNKDSMKICSGFNLKTGLPPIPARAESI